MWFLHLGLLFACDFEELAALIAPKIWVGKKLELQSPNGDSVFFLGSGHTAKVLRVNDKTLKEGEDSVVVRLYDYHSPRAVDRDGWTPYQVAKEEQRMYQFGKKFLNGFGGSQFDVPEVYGASRGNVLSLVKDSSTFDQTTGNLARQAPSLTIQSIKGQSIYNIVTKKLMPPADMKKLVDRYNSQVESFAKHYRKMFGEKVYIDVNYHTFEDTDLLLADAFIRAKDFSGLGHKFKDLTMGINPDAVIVDKEKFWLIDMR